MEIIEILFNPFTLLVIAFIGVLGFAMSPYEIQFEEKDEEEDDICWC